MSRRTFGVTIVLGLCIIRSGCTTTDRPGTELPQRDTVVMDVPVIPDEPPSGQEPQRTPASQPAETAEGEVQERGVMRLAPGAFQSPVTGTFASSYPGEFAFRTQKGYYLTAISGGGRPSDPTIITSATSAGPWEKFKLALPNPSTSHDKAIQTVNGNYVTAMGGGGRTSDVLHTDATQVKDWERAHCKKNGGTYAITNGLESRTVRAMRLVEQLDGQSEPGGRIGYRHSA